MDDFWEYVPAVFSHPLFLDEGFASLNETEKHSKLLDIFLRRAPCEVQERHSAMLTAGMSLTSHKSSMLGRCCESDSLTKFVSDIDSYGQFMHSMLDMLEYLSQSGAAELPEDRSCDIDNLVSRANTIGVSLARMFIETDRLSLHSDCVAKVNELIAISNSMTQVGEDLLNGQVYVAKNALQAIRNDTGYIARAEEAATR